MPRGGTIIVVQGTLTVAGTISAGALGGMGGTNGGPGKGGGAWGGNLGPTSPTRTLGAFFSSGAISSTNPYAMAPLVQRYMVSGGGNPGGGSLQPGTAGSAWPLTAASPFDARQQDPKDWVLLLALLDLMRDGAGYNDSTVGAIGGGGGGGGVATTDSGTGGNYGGSGSGIGGGGGGGNGSSGSGPPNGGRGGGVLVILTNTLVGAGTIHADGANGANGSLANGTGGGGGGGGGAVAVAYHALGGTTPTVRANGGSGGTGARSGGAGGAGVATSFQIKVA